MKTKRRREKSKVAYTNTKEYLEKSQSGFEATAYKIPNGCHSFRFQKGKNVLDFMPYVVKSEHNPKAQKGKAHWERTYYVHNIPTPRGNRRYCCLDMNWKEPCPICKCVAKIRRQGKMEEKDIRALEPKERVLFCVIDRKNKEKGYGILESGNYKSFGELINDKLDSLDEDDPRRDFFHLSDGMTVEVSAKEDSWDGRKFNKPTIIDFVPRKDQYDNDMLEEVPCLDKCLIKMKPEELLEIFENGGLGDEDEPKKKKKTKASDDDEEDDDEEDDDTGDTDEDEESDDDEEDDEVDEDDEKEDKEDDEDGSEEVDDDDMEDESDVEVGDLVSWMKGKKVLKGTVKKILEKAGKAKVKENKTGKLVTVDLDELTKIEEEEPKKKRKKVEDEEEEEEDLDDDDTDEDESEDDSDDGEDEDEDEDDEEEDEEPRKKKKRNKFDDEDDDRPKRKKRSAD
jgi:hypothetical protein